MNNSDQGPIAAIIFLVALVLLLTAFWKIFTKAGRPGWLSLVPVVNLYNLVLIAGRPGWWIVFFLIPIANVFVAISITLELAKRFRNSVPFGIGMILLPVIFYPLLAFSDASYEA